MLRHHNLPQSRQSGFLLIEAMVAIVIFSLGVIALMGFQSIAIGESIKGKYRTEASYLANSIIGQMMVDKANFTGYADGGSAAARTSWNTLVSASLPNGAGSITITPNATANTVTVAISWRAPDDTSAHNFTTVSQILFQ